ncbi:MAG TPA: CBS domain-containing protein [Pseudomonas xinjiangensis]|uniref:CBS domain-containing protein n=2 Tax=root TaxID=1 RepID=A0A7V1FQJ6_9GAMM|nr:CBS domain-containing protein [Halopseudomonas xinjiangensis]HEC48185.1 CBS domain-containing protein [Halopseudomonas xinjiangensis]
MQIKELMTSRPEFSSADASIREVATRMQEQDSGFVPIADGEQLVGVITDRDMALRALANGKNPDDKISTIMTSEIRYCFEDDNVNTVLQEMRAQQLQRLVVLDNPEEKDFVGVVSLSDIADNCHDSDMALRIVECCKHYQ